MPKQQQDQAKWTRTELHSIDRGNGNFIVICKLSNDKGWEGLDIRLNFTPEDSDELRPTKKGIAIPIPLCKVIGKILIEQGVDDEGF